MLDCSLNIVAQHFVINIVQNKLFQFFNLIDKYIKLAGAELGQAQVKLYDIVKAVVEVEVQLLFRVGGWSDKTKLILISILVEVVVDVVVTAVVQVEV